MGKENLLCMSALAIAFSVYDEMKIYNVTNMGYGKYGIR